MTFEFQLPPAILSYLVPICYHLMPLSSSFICPQQSFLSSQGPVHTPSSSLQALTLGLCQACSFSSFMCLFKSLLLRESCPEHPLPLNLLSVLLFFITRMSTWHCIIEFIIICFIEGMVLIPFAYFYRPSMNICGINEWKPVWLISGKWGEKWYKMNQGK